MSCILTSAPGLQFATWCKGCSNSAPEPTIPRQQASHFLQCILNICTTSAHQKCRAEILIKFPVSENHQVIPARIFNGIRWSDLRFRHRQALFFCQKAGRILLIYSVSSATPSHSARSPKSLSWLTALKTTWNLWKQVAHAHRFPWNLDQSRNLQLKTQCYFHY